jgi:phosphoenolpyruvate carboxykinase (ATP)
MPTSESASRTSLNLAFQNLGAEALIEHAIRNQEGSLAGNGALVVRTGQFTGRSPGDKFIVRDTST